MKIYNTDTIVSIVVNDKKVYNYVVWKEKRKGSWFKGKDKPEGFYSHDSDRHIGQEEDLKNGAYYISDVFTREKTHFPLIVENNVAYWRPNVTINFTNKSGENIRFWTIEEAESYANGLSERFLPRSIKIK